MILASCSKDREPLVWTSDYSVPLFYGELGIASILPDTLIHENSDSSIVIKFEGNLFDFDLSEIVTIPDTVIRDSFAVAFPTPIQFAPGQSFINDPQEEVLQLGDVALKYVEIKSGKLKYELKSTIQGSVIYTYQIPSATDWQGNIFSKSVTVQAATSGSLQIVEGEFDLTGYFLDLTGTSGGSFNKVLTNINCKVDPSNTSSVPISSADKILISNEISGIVVQEARGYFGQHSIQTGAKIEDFSVFQKFISGGIEIDDLDVEVVLKNGIGVDVLAKINAFRSIRNGDIIALQNNIIGQLISLTRAMIINGDITPTEYDFSLNDQNSNIIDFLELLPLQLGYDLDLEINPLGNISGYNDFYNADAPMGIFLNAELPLSFIANELVIQDTLTIDISSLEQVNQLTLKFKMENGFPIEANVQLAVLDQNDHIIDRVFSPENIPSGILDQSGKVVDRSLSYNEVTLNAKNLERIRSNGKLILTVKFDTSNGQKVVIYSDNTLKYSVAADANITISTN